MANLLRMNIWHYFLSWKNQDVLFGFSQNIDKEIFEMMNFFSRWFELRSAGNAQLFKCAELLVNIKLIHLEWEKYWSRPKVRCVEISHCISFRRRKIFKKVSGPICDLMRPRLVNNDWNRQWSQVFIALSVRCISYSNNRHQSKKID